jgi:tetratricopeptide (TPR) repeat protein
MLRRVTPFYAAPLVTWFATCLPAQNVPCGPNEYNCAIFYVEHQNFQKAVVSLETVLRQSPQDLKALNLLGIALTETGQIDSANRTFRQALAVNLHFYPARKNLAVNQFNRGHSAEAAAEFNKVLQDAPDDEIANLYLAEIDFARKKFSIALKHYEKGGRRISLKTAWLLHYAQCLIERNDRAKAVTVLKLLPENDGEDRLQAGMLLGRANAYAQAAELFASARKHYHDPYVAGYNQLLMLIRAGSYPDAIQTFHDLVGERYKTAELYNVISEAYLKTGHVQEAYDALRTATQIEPKAEDNYVDLASVCLEYEDYSLGKDILDVGLHYIPNSYRLYIQRGVTFVMRGALDEAEKDFQAANNLAPDRSLPYFALGWVWIQSAQTEKAVKVLREKSKLPGTDYLVPYVLGVALVHSGAEPGTALANEAVEAFEASIRLNPGFSHSHAELGKLLYKEGAVDRAIAELTAATKLDPNDSRPLYTLAQAYRKKGQQAEANQMMARVTQLHSEDHNQDLKKELIRLVRKETTSSTQAQATP